MFGMTHETFPLETNVLLLAGTGRTSLIYSYISLQRVMSFGKLVNKFEQIHGFTNKPNIAATNQTEF
jgi:hypothetical protein